VGYQSDGATPIYAGVAPQPYGEFQMALYTDSYCLNPDTSFGKTYDDYVSYTSLNLGSKHQNGRDSESAQVWWYNAQEYKLTELNSVYDDFKYCTSCVDNPTYQDGYFIGDSVVDGGNLINQCWQFHSHNSYVCDADCIAKANAQGTILSVTIGTTTFGKAFYITEESEVTTSFGNALDTFYFIAAGCSIILIVVIRHRCSRTRRYNAVSVRSDSLSVDEYDVELREHKNHATDTSYNDGTKNGYDAPKDLASARVVV
jgi:hypothetical protein